MQIELEGIPRSAERLSSDTSSHSWYVVLAIVGTLVVAAAVWAAVAMYRKEQSLGLRRLSVAVLVIAPFVTFSSLMFWWEGWGWWDYLVPAVLTGVATAPASTVLLLGGTRVNRWLRDGFAQDRQSRLVRAGAELAVPIGGPSPHARKEIARGHESRPVSSASQLATSSIAVTSASEHPGLANASQTAGGRLRMLGLVLGTGALAFIAYSVLVVLVTTAAGFFQSKGLLEAALLTNALVSPLLFFFVATWLLLFGWFSNRREPRGWGIGFVCLGMFFWLVPYAGSFLLR